MIAVSVSAALQSKLLELLSEAGASVTAAEVVGVASEEGAEVEAAPVASALYPGRYEGE